MNNILITYEADTCLDNLAVEYVHSHKAFLRPALCVAACLITARLYMADEYDLPSCTEGCSRLTCHFGSRVVFSLIASRPQPKLYQRPQKSAPSSVSPSPSNFSVECTIPPTYANYYCPRGCLTGTLYLMSGRPR